MRKREMRPLQNTWLANEYQHCLRVVRRWRDRRVEAEAVPLSDSADIHLLTTYSEEVSSPSSSSGSSSSSSSSSSSHTRKCVPLLNSTNIPDHLFTNNKHYDPKSRNFYNGDSDHGRDRDKDKDKDNVADSEMTDRNSLESLVTSVNFASILILQGAPSRAQSILEGVLMIRPLFIPALKLLAYILLRERKFEEALHLLKLS